MQCDVIQPSLFIPEYAIVNGEMLIATIKVQPREAAALIGSRIWMIKTKGFFSFKYNIIITDDQGQTQETVAVGYTLFSWGRYKLSVNGGQYVIHIAQSFFSVTFKIVDEKERQIVEFANKVGLGRVGTVRFDLAQPTTTHVILAVLGLYQMTQIGMEKSA
jgi:hypothetical protein